MAPRGRLSATLPSPLLATIHHRAGVEAGCFPRVRGRRSAVPVTKPSAAAPDGAARNRPVMQGTLAGSVRNSARRADEIAAE